MNQGTIIQNAVKVKDGGKVIYLNSCHVHHFNRYDFQNGKDWYAVDGGKEYARRAYSSSQILENVENYCLSSDSPQKEMQDKLLWGSLVNGEVVFRPIKDLTMEHLQAILDTQHGIGVLHKRVVTYWLEQRIKHLEKVVNRTAKSKSQKQ